MFTQEEGIASRERDVFENAEFPILVRDFGKSRRSRRRQPRNVPSPMDSRAQPSFAARRLVQRANASAPRDVSESGREMCSRSTRSENAPAAIAVTGAPSMASGTARSFDEESAKRMHASPPFDAIAVSCLVGAVYGSCLKRKVRSRVIHVSQGGMPGGAGTRGVARRSAAVCGKRSVRVPRPPTARRDSAGEEKAAARSSRRGVCVNTC